VRRTLAALIVILSMATPVLAEEQATSTARPGPLSIYSAADLARPADPSRADLRVVPLRDLSRLGTSRRPAALPALYVSLAALNALDVYSTTRALGNGAREVNPVMASTRGNSGVALAIKAATTTSSIYLAERLWKKNRIASIATMLAANGVTAAIVAHNLRNAR